MSSDNIVSKVAAGLRRMGIKPTYLLFCDANTDGWVWDEEKIAGIPVLHSGFIQNTGADVPFIPLWDNPNDMRNSIERKRFNDGYENAD